MPLPDVTEKWTSRIAEVTLGVEPNQIKIGGHSTLPFLNFEGETPHKPVIAMEVMDIEPQEWVPVLKEPFGDALKSPVEWAKKCVDEYNADMICISLVGIHPDFGNLPVEHAADVVQSVANEISVPLMVWGCGDTEKDNLTMPQVAELLQGKNALLGSALEDNYKTLVAACQMAGHNLIAESPCDINIAKQLNILISETGFPLERVVIYPTTGALGYGFEYIYSIMERGRLAALSGDKMMSSPVISRIGPEVWRVKEAQTTLSEQPHWGPVEERGPMWEAMTASTLFMSGSDIMLLRHPKAVEITRKMINELMEK